MGSTEAEPGIHAARHSVALAWLRSPWLHATALALTTLVAWLAPGLRTAPLHWDPAYFTYMGQAVLRGEPIYSHTFMAYPPLGPLVLAAVMKLGSAFDVPSWLSVRYAGVLCGVLSVLLVQAAAKRATGSAWAGLVAGVALAGFDPLARSYLVTLEPKHLVILFTLVATCAGQRGRWTLAGAAAALAVTSYQPAVLTGAAFGLLALRASWLQRDRSVLAFALGVAVALLPSAAYLVASGSWGDFWVRTVLLTANARVPTAGLQPLHWLDIIGRFYRPQLLFLVAGALGWTLHALDARLRAPGRRVQAWLDPGSAGMTLLALLWCAGAALEFQGTPDAYPLLPLAAFWAAWLAHRSVRALRRSLGPPLDRAARVGAAVAAAWVALAVLVAFRDVPFAVRMDVLAWQLAEAERIVGPPDSHVVALSAEEVYVLSERQSPLPFLRLPLDFQPFLPRVGFADCGAVARRVLADHPRAVALRIPRFSPGACEATLGQILAAAGYQRTESLLGLRIYWRDGVPEQTR